MPAFSDSEVREVRAMWRKGIAPGAIATALTVQFKRRRSAADISRVAADIGLVVTDPPVAADPVPAAPPPPALPPIEPPPGGVGFADLRGRFDRQCRWPIECHGPEHRYCGGRTDGRSPYCADHHQRAVGQDHAGTGTIYPGWGRKPAPSRDTGRTRG
ncbi:hypothetical protein [Methylobacterium aquaticum]|uniref:GcrA cell cycle regulator n=1 Tax=Methylobacterium aquaticum TaxID=270351 RepID=A0A0C6FP18_9HYPH|nr:hypothetical protein [Methylobacterium aquaticum]BAQ44355.1 hypothetical protein Maq22A_c04725 [Methylobacterium aquaticum]